MCVTLSSDHVWKLGFFDDDYGCLYTAQGAEEEGYTYFVVAAGAGGDHPTKWAQWDAPLWDPKRRKVTIRDVATLATLYGQWPHDTRVWYLSPYEFVTHREPQLLSYPLSRNSVGGPAHHVVMTESGL